MHNFENVLEITSAQNERVKRAEKLKNRRDRNKTGSFLVEGYRELLRCIEAGWEIEELFFAPSLFLKTNEPALIEKSNAELVRLKESIFQKLSYRDRPDGLLAIVKQQKKAIDDLEKVKNPFYIVAESIEKPGNLGTILRSSDAAGTDGVIVTDPCTDIFNPNVVRASIGTLFTQPVVVANNQETEAFLSGRNIQVVAASPHAKKEFTHENLTGPVAVIVGSEQYGLSDTWYKRADLHVKIPMRGKADSLNVAQATTLLLYEILRQRDGS